MSLKCVPPLKLKYSAFRKTEKFNYRKSILWRIIKYFNLENETFSKAKLMFIFVQNDLKW